MSFRGNNSPDEIRLALQNFHKNEIKLVVKEAIKEWLDGQAVIVGKWSLRFILMAALGALTYFILTTNGWHK